MRKIFLLLPLFLSFACSSFGQSDTLFLKITDLKKAKVLLQLNGAQPLALEGATISPSSNPGF